MSLEIRRVLKERAAAAGLELPDRLESALLAYYVLLFRWNRKINLTSLTDPAQAVDRLLIEPCLAATHLPREARLIDLGSGGGSPAIPLALALGSAHLVMVESRSRKAAFLREAAREVQLSAMVEAIRFEGLAANSEYRHAADVVSLRAVRPDLATLTLAADLARPDGLVALFASSTAELPAPPELVERSTWNLLPSAMLITFHVKHN